MSILNAMSILGAGIGKGYQASQALQREIAEARRKALIEERETAVRERLAAAEEGYKQAQGREIEENILGSRGTRERAAKQDLLLDQPVSSSPLSLDLLGNRVKLPASLRTLSDPNLSDLFARLNEEANRKAGGYYQNVGGGSRAPESLELVLRLMRRQPPTFIAADPIRLDEWERNEETRLLRNLPRYVREFDLIRSGKSTDSSILGIDPADPLGILKDEAVYDFGNKRNFLKE